MIKFNQFAVVNGAEKAKVHYHASDFGGVERVTIYARDYGHALGRVFAGFDVYENDSDVMTDYFDKGRVVLKKGHPLYAAALERANLNDAKRNAKDAIRKAKWSAAVAASA
jgi:hypothetical protein